MASGKTARRLLIFPKSADAPKVTTDIEGLANQLDNDAEILTGTLAGRSGFKLFGRLFYVQGDAAPANNGLVWLDTGATWAAINTPANGQVYGGLTERVNATEYEPSSSRATFVMLYAGTVKNVAAGNGSLTLEAEVGGHLTPTITSASVTGGATATAVLPFIVPAGVKWKPLGAVSSEPNLGALLLKSVYLPL